MKSIIFVTDVWSLKTVRGELWAPGCWPWEDGQPSEGYPSKTYEKGGEVRIGTQRSIGQEKQNRQLEDRNWKQVVLSPAKAGGKSNALLEGPLKQQYH